MKTIKQALQHIENEEKVIDKIARFLKTKKGQKFVMLIHTAPLDELVRRLKAPKYILYYKNNQKNKNIINAILKKNNIVIPMPISPPPGLVKVPKTQIKLTKKEYKAFNTAKHPRKMGFAALMHAYEEHKMARYIAENPAPTKKELAEDLFPDELMAGYNTKLWIHREYVRDFLCRVYCNIIPHKRYYRAFKVYSKPTSRGNVISECEMDRPVVADKNISRKELREKLLMLAKNAKDADKDVIKMKIYDKYGNLHMTHSFVNR